MEVARLTRADPRVAAKKGKKKKEKGSGGYRPLRGLQVAKITGATPSLWGSRTQMAIAPLQAQSPPAALPRHSSYMGRPGQPTVRRHVSTRRQGDSGSRSSAFDGCLISRPGSALAAPSSRTLGHWSEAPPGLHGGGVAGSVTTPPAFVPRSTELSQPRRPRALRCRRIGKQRHSSGP